MLVVVVSLVSFEKRVNNNNNNYANTTKNSSNVISAFILNFLLLVRPW